MAPFWFHKYRKSMCPVKWSQKTERVQWPDSFSMKQVSNKRECSKRQHLAGGCSQCFPEQQQCCVVPGLVPPEKALAFALLWWCHFGQTHAHQKPAWGHFAMLFLLLLTQTSKHTGPAAVTTALYGPVCLRLCNGHVLETGLGCCDPMLNTAASQRRRTPSVCYTRRQKTKMVDLLAPHTQHDRRERQPSRVTF